MLTYTAPPLADKRHPKVRFGWVKRLMQGQGRLPQPPSLVPIAPKQQKSPRHHPTATSNRYKPKASPTSSSSLPSSRSARVRTKPHSRRTTESSADAESDRDDERGSMATEESDNVSTIPLKSIVSFQSTHTPSIISTGPRDSASANGSTTNTSLAPSAQPQPQNPHPILNVLTANSSTHESNRGTDADNTRHANFISPQSMTSHNSMGSAGSNGGFSAAVAGMIPDFTAASSTLSPPPDRDSESIVTLASSSRRRRRKSIETNSSTTGIAPASIFERLGPNLGNTGASSYAPSMRTSNTEHTAPEDTEG